MAKASDMDEEETSKKEEASPGEMVRMNMRE